MKGDEVMLLLLILAVLQVESLSDPTAPMLPLPGLDAMHLQHQASVRRSQAAWPFSATDDVLVSQPFVYEQAYSGFGCNSGNGWMLAEDCYPSTDLAVQEVDLWMIFSSGVPAAQYNLGFQGDEDGPDGIFIWQSTETDVTSENTGFSGWGYDFWYIHVSIAEPFSLEAGQAYWFCLQAVSSPATYALGAINQPAWDEMFYMSLDNGDTWNSSLNQFGIQLGLFLILEGPATSLDRTTWGRIKTLH